MAQEAGVELSRPNGADTVVDRSIEEIRQDIERTRQNISGTVDTLGAKLHEQLDWREYVRRKPFVAVGVGVGAGLLISRMIVSKPKPPANFSDFIASTLAKTVRQIARPKHESFATGAFKMLAGLVVTRVAQSLHEEPNQQHLDHDRQFSG
jgi:ElaB/YqjD/DUF883 family membrane-anchored ribosome-binding protein